MWLAKTILAFLMPLVVATNHETAHTLGKQLYQRYGLGGITHCTTDFAYGCFHGLAENALVRQPDKLIEIASSCEHLGKSGSGPYVSCIHGLGHGIVSLYSETKLLAALIKCNQLGQFAQYCHDGVFMEAGISEWKFSCDNLPGNYQAMCWRNMPAIWHKQNLSWDEIAKRCQDRECLASIGRQVAQIYKGDPLQIQKSCPDASCLTAAAGEIVFQKLPNWEAKTTRVCAGNTDCLKFVTQVATDYAILRTTDPRRP